METNSHVWRPSRAFYAVAIGIVIVGALACGFFIFRGMTQTRGKVLTLNMPGSSPLNLPNAGTYTIFYQTIRLGVGTNFPTTENMPKLNIEVTDRGTGQVIPLSAATEQLTYPIPKNTGISVLQFHLDGARQVQVKSGYLNGASTPPFLLAVAYGLPGQLVGHVLVGFGFFFIAVAIGLGFGSFVFFRRRTAEKWNHIADLELRPPPYILR